MGNASFVIIYLLSLLVLVSTAVYAHNLRRNLDEMHGMMVGMTFAMTAGLVTATLYVLSTGDFLYGFIGGSIIGLLFGVPLGKLGGHLGIMEGVIAGPMGGMMGAMLGQMVRPFNIGIFIPFFMFIFLITMIGIAYAVNCGASCCPRDTNEEKNNELNVDSVRYKISGKFILLWAIPFFIVLTASFALPFSLDAGTPQKAGDTSPVQDSKIQAKEEQKEAVMNGSFQEVELKITAAKYSPDVIIAKRGIPLKIKVSADKNAGCGREIVFPDFNIDKIVQPGSVETIEINPDKEGTFKFRCSMDMLRGKLVIQ